MAPVLPINDQVELGKKSSQKLEYNYGDSKTSVAKSPTHHSEMSEGRID
jgi:hypothetical protein